MIPFTIKYDYVSSIFVVTGGTIRNNMPDVVTVVTTGLGVSVLAGVLSGVCYVLVNGFGSRRSQKRRNRWHCEICGTPLNSTKQFLDDNIVTCFKCRGRVCKEKCSRYIQRGEWICQNCLLPEQSWYQGIVKTILSGTNYTVDLFDTNMEERAENPDFESLRKLEKEEVRDFIEKLVNVMLGENVDNASVSMLYNDKQYLPVSGQSPCTAHTALKQIIEKLLKEAVNLPLLEKAHALSAIADEENKNKTYEDLLATAIINKVVGSCQNNLPSSSANSVSSRVSTSSRYKDDKEYFFSDETLENKWKTTDLDSTSVSSVDEWIHSESSFGSRKYVDKVTLMIKQDIEEVDHLDSEPDNDDENDAEYFRSTSSLLTDSESNWLLQRRHFHGTPSPVPVPMLVPNPTIEAKVLIGDKPLDDTSDLSDIGSDYEDLEHPQATHSLLVQSKNIIGGGNSKLELLENGDVHSESSSTDSGVKEVNGQEEKPTSTLESHKTDISVDDDNVEDSSYVSVYSNTEKEAEYTEKYGSLPRQIIKQSTDIASVKEKLKDDSWLSTTERDEMHHSYSDNEFCGNYSKKEKEKWNHAVEMKNNPYSKENIEKRLQRSKSAASSIYNSNDAVKLAKIPSAGSDRISRISLNWPPSEPPRDDSPPPPPISSATPPLDLLQNHSFTSDQKVYDHINRAVPAVVIPEEKMPQYLVKNHVSVTTSSPVNSDIRNFALQTHSSEITSDSDVSYVNSYDVEHSQVIKETKDRSLHIPIKAVPFGISYKAIADENGNGDVANNNVVITHTTEHKTNVVKPVPVARPRSFIEFTRSDSHDTENYVSSTHVSEHNLNRQVSETNFHEDSYDTPPKILSQKPDNTIISKIYKDPKVRLFAMKSRDDSPMEQVKYQTQMSVELSSSHNKNYGYHTNREKTYPSSEDGLSSEYESGKTGKMSFFSSDEDLLSTYSDASRGRHENVVSSTNEYVITNGQSEDDKHYYMKHNVSIPKSPSTRKFIYGSQENLLAIDEVGSIPKRKDNTLITKIYSDPRVWSFALKTHADNLPNLEPTTPITSTPNVRNSTADDDYFFSQASVLKKTTASNKIYKSYDDLSSGDISLENNYHQESDNLHEQIREGYNSEDIDIDEIGRRHLVSSALGRFSKSEVNIQRAFIRSMSQEDEIRVSVRDLRKKFESDNNRNPPVVSSLTARSLSKKVKDILKL